MRDLLRMAANAIHYLAVFENHSARALYLGRTKRIASADQRIICYARDRGCTRPGCTEPGYHCEVNHDPAWAAGGKTDADCLFFDCEPDHTLVSKGLLQTKVTDTGTEPSQRWPPVCVSTLNHMEIRVMVAVRVAAITATSDRARYVQAVQRRPAIMARIRPTASAWTWCVKPRGGWVKYR